MDPVALQGEVLALKARLRGAEREMAHMRCVYYRSYLCFSMAL